jgi:hypothetical protein
LGLSHRLDRLLCFLKPDTQRCLGGIHYFTAPTRVRLEATDLPSRASLHHRPQTQGPERVLYRPVSKHPAAPRVGTSVGTGSEVAVHALPIPNPPPNRPHSDSIPRQADSVPPPGPAARIGRVSTAI